MAVTFESMERRMPKIEKCLAEYGIASLEEARELCNSKGFDAYDIVKGVQPIAFENAGWAYTLGCAVAIKKGVKTAAEAAECIGIGLEAFCIPGPAQAALAAHIARPGWKMFRLRPMTRRWRS